MQTPCHPEYLDKRLFNQRLAFIGVTEVTVKKIPGSERAAFGKERLWGWKSGSLEPRKPGH
jgi:hypothetical protein